jgi:nucleoside-diphosphate-sugar epimerase|nr:NAD-dependent epimerase/dehydratase family protein [Variovorax sp. OK605]
MIMTTYFVTGATGYIGGSVVASLIEGGHAVRGLARNERNAELLAQRGVEPVLGDLDNLDLLYREAKASDGVINTASADHAAAIGALIDGLRGAGKPLLHTSGSSVVGDDARGARNSENIYDEDTPFVVAQLKQPRRDIDLTVLAAAEKGVRSIVICPSLIYGRGRGIHQDSVQIPFLASNAIAQGHVQVVGSGLNVWSNVHIEDVVSLYLLAIQKSVPGAFYFAENGEASFADIGAALAKRLNLSGVQSLPAEIAAERWGEAKAYFSLGSNSRVRGHRARRDLGWAPKHRSVLSWIEHEMPV